MENGLKESVKDLGKSYIRMEIYIQGNGEKIIGKVQGNMNGHRSNVLMRESGMISSYCYG